MVCSKDPENINIKMDEDVLEHVPKFKYVVTIFTEGGKTKDDIIQRIVEANIMSNNKEQLLYSNNLSVELKNKLQKVVFGVSLVVDQKHGP